MESSRPDFIVGIGGSAGALDGYKELLDGLPADGGMAFVIISHMTPEASSKLAEILSRFTKMPVSVAASGMPIQRNRVYVIPPDADLLIEDHAFKVVSPRTGRNIQADLFFNSLAEAMGPRAIGIIMSGYDGDGSKGCAQIKAKGGITFTQDMSAEVDSMPLSAQASGHVDFVLPLDKIPAELQKISNRFNKLGGGALIEDSLVIA
ncbi:MAG: hypothetical protein A2901_06030 [Elusimicrobia bacterium RIFCSPLOWO2_01_FULL_54_10]|nr:MAG: hypothetical protein A2901_06030 [Elusimicrobia bacterium RIFCSPLOWO2_01_FULL_54_10]